MVKELYINAVTISRVIKPIYEQNLATACFYMASKVKMVLHFKM